jgi:hypothetical protein
MYDTGSQQHKIDLVEENWRGRNTNTGRRAIGQRERERADRRQFESGLSARSLVGFPARILSTMEDGPAL